MNEPDKNEVEAALAEEKATTEKIKSTVRAARPTPNPEYTRLFMNTRAGAICLKERGDHGTWRKADRADLLERKFGRLSSPEIVVGQVTPDTFAEVANAHPVEFVVIGHLDDPHVWRGDLYEFLETWELD